MVRLGHITFACEEPRDVAAFWSGVLGYEAEPDRRGDAWQAVDPDGEGPRLVFERQPKSPTIELPIHLDVNTPDREAEVDRLRALGGHIVETKTSSVGAYSETFTVMRDVEGNGFCVQGPDPRRPRSYIGNVTFSCAEPLQLGGFWSTLLGWPAEEVGADFLQGLRDAGLDEREFTAFYAARNPDGSRPRLFFQRREKSRPEWYPIHLDLEADDREAELERLSTAGATLEATRSEGGRTWRVMRDPEQNPFCVR
jgi:predicted enzyme related to lactoylglutathione lyase